MKIMLDATPLLLASAGVKGVLYHWIEALRAHAPEGTIHLYPPIPHIGPLNHQHSVAGRFTTLRGIAMTLANQHFNINLPERFSQGMDLFHSTNQVRTAPTHCALTATVHDLTCWRMPAFHTAANIEADRRYAENTLQRADGLISVSDNSRRDAIELLGISPDRIRTIYNGVADAYFDVEAPAPRPRPYVLHAGTIEPRKNIDTLLDAWQLLPPSLRDAFDLIIAGPAGWNADSTVARLEAAPRGVTWLGYVPESRMPALTRGASLLVYPSLYEGFGLPLAQAMACGTAAITSNTSCLPEVAGPAARLVDPLSASELRSALIDLLDDEDERTRLGAEGRARANQLFRWSRNAQLSLAFFEEVLSRR